MFSVRQISIMELMKSAFVSGLFLVKSILKSVTPPVFEKVYLIMIGFNKCIM